MASQIHNLHYNLPVTNFTSTPMPDDTRPAPGSGEKLDRLKALLREMFQLERGDLDFGLYRIMGMKSAEVAAFLDKDLLPQVQGRLKLTGDSERADLEKEIRDAEKDADVVNVLTAPVILRKEVVAADRRIYCADENAAAEFEMLTLSMYQKFNDERREIVESGLSSGRFYDV